MPYVHYYRVMYGDVYTMYLLQWGWLWEEEKLGAVCVWERVREMENKSYLQLYTSLRGTKGFLFKLAPNMKFSSDQKSDYRKEQQEWAVQWI